LLEFFSENNFFLKIFLASGHVLPGSRATASHAYIRVDRNWLNSLIFLTYYIGAPTHINIFLFPVVCITVIIIAQTVTHSLTVTEIESKIIKYN